MSGETKKRIAVDGVYYTIDEGRGAFEAIVSDIRRVLTDGGLAEVPVMDGDGNPVVLLLPGSQVSAVVIDSGVGSRPNEMSP